MLNLKGLSMSSVNVLIALLGVCSSDTIIAEYDVVRNRESRSRNKNTILDERFSGERGDPGMRLQIELILQKII
jgi:hypothetical protein